MKDKINYFIVQSTIIIVGIGSIVLFTYAMLSGFINQERANESYLPVEAIVIDSEVRNTNTNKNNEYYPFITYSYVIKGNRYESSTMQLYIQETYNNYEQANAILINYKQGTIITAYYDPNEPSSAILINGKPPLYGLIIGLFCNGIILLFVIGFSWANRVSYIKNNR
jgi:hypothetical protein